MTLSGYLQECAARSAGVLGDDLDASVTLRQHGLTVHAGSSSDDAARCDRAEAMADDGPCIDAMVSGLLVDVAAVADEDRWLQWRRQSLEAGFVKALAVPSQVAPGIAVALNLYSRSPGPWGERLVGAAEEYSRLIAGAVRLQLEFANLDDAAGALFRGASHTAILEQAVGAVMETNGCSEQAAQELIRSAARRRGVPEREIATTVLRSLVAYGTGNIVDDRLPGP
ncbi:ANTAR domain-containing protein [Isoptericola sp. CG 20/1183]|uniref:ANTAR domain-containing protein n=1 Tax=Isoptericola halotolerans TaxID=300560 RepID=A0ABX5EAM4_9MICO|nr:MULTISPECIES: ANTAR domain-containing protein [Isoptericola]PRZ02645.1 ANTAR domain-containing protein [Isoptericola sp. CG 20/1183]PRZ02997.1 ANTAR domain-containing protein [Isoptericola halotolerans]